MLSRKLITVSVSAVASGLLLAGCGNNDGSGGGNSTTASFSLTDAPVDNVANVFVTFTRLDIKPSEGEALTFELDEPRQIDLLTLQGGNAAPLIEDVEIDPGEYEWLRLFVNGGCASGADCVDGEGSQDSFVVQDGGGEVELFIPGNQPPSQNPNPRFLHLASPFLVTAGSNADFTIDVELRKALTDPVGQDHYLLRPALRLVNNVEVGTISGTVDSTLLDSVDETCANDLTADEGNDVYLYTGPDADIGDINLDADGNPDHDVDDTDGVSPESNPLTSAEVTQNAGTGVYEYEIGFVTTGDYTIAFTCQSLDDQVETDEAIEFVQPQNVNVQAGQVSEVNFSAAPAP
jgi:hypothetical protein